MDIQDFHQIDDFYNNWTRSIIVTENGLSLQDEEDRQLQLALKESLENSLNTNM